MVLPAVLMRKFIISYNFFEDSQEKGHLVRWPFYKKLKILNYFNI